MSDIKKFQLRSINSPESNKKLQYILHVASGLKIIVFPLQIFPLFEPTPGEHHYFGQLFQWWHAFETWELRESQEEFIADALRWYAELKLFPGMMPTLIDPRRRPNINVN